jgi:CubicO group peptidase (beta-lactamase class C family)
MEVPRDVVALDHVARIVTEELRAAPAATVAANLRHNRGEGAAGKLWSDDLAPPAIISTPFDLASVTKPFTALTFARLCRSGELASDALLGDVVPWLASTAAGSCPLILLAAHRSGLEAHLRLYEPLVEGREVDRREAILTAAGSRRSECDGELPREGFAPVYSDMGYLLLGLALEECSGLPLDELVRREVTAPLGIDTSVGSARQLRALDPTFDDRVAPTEIVTFRGGVVRGVVHDENAWAVAGSGLAGHAGLFGDALSVATLGRAILDALEGDRGWLAPVDLEPLLVPRPGGSLLAGFDARSGEPASSGTRLSPRTFGHLGFTGTSLWIDPELGFVGVLLSNRVHPSRDHIAIRVARPAAYDAMFDAISRGSGR